MPEPSPILRAAERLILQRGYEAVTLAEIARAASMSLDALQEVYSEKNDLLLALLDIYSPADEIQAALTQTANNAQDAETYLRDSLQTIIQIINDHPRFIDFALLDLQINQGAYLNGLALGIAGSAIGFVKHLADMPGVRPISSVLLARTLAAMLIGFIATQHFAPRPAQFAMRIFPQRAWVDSMADILLYGILESE